MNLSEAIALSSGVVALVVAAFAVIDGVRRGKKWSLNQLQIVNTSAVKLAESLREQTESLEGRLKTATDRADTLSEQLRRANTQVDDLKRQHDQMGEQLADAQAEVRVLRGQVKTLTQELDRRNNTGGLQ
jgi:chromosome segregation ATPase